MKQDTNIKYLKLFCFWYNVFFKFSLVADVNKQVWKWFLVNVLNCPKQYDAIKTYGIISNFHWKMFIWKL